MVPPLDLSVLEELKKKVIIPKTPTPGPVRNKRGEIEKVIKIKRSDGKYSYITQKVMDRINYDK